MKQTLLKAIKEAGKISLDNFTKIKKINFKKDDELVTNVDLECENKIKEIISKNYPEHKILGEEYGETTQVSDYMWIIDPIDGTVNFSRGINLFGISIALARENEVIMGGVYNPLFDELFFAEKNNGTFLNGKRIQVSQEKNLSRSVVYVTELYKSYPYVSKIFQKVKQFRITSSSAYETSLVADGRIDAFIKVTTHPWGFAAASLIVEEAGGKVTNSNGSKWDINSTQILASNGIIHEELLNLLSRDT